MYNNAVKIENLTKNYAEICALNNISFSVKEGELFGLIGPDGAGKTTAFRILCGLLSFDSGTNFIFDFDINKQIDKIREIIGYMPQRFSLYPDLTVAENLRFFADLFQVDKKEREQRLIRLLKFSNLAPFQSRRANDLSGGMKQKLALSCTLIHTPKILILDEPTTGVDPVSRREFWEILKELNKQGVTILISTSYMDEAGLCDRVAFIHQGKIMAINKPGNLKQYFNSNLLEIETSALYDTFLKLKQNPMFIQSQLFGDRIHITVKSLTKAKEELKKIGIPISAIKEIQPTIEDVFVELIKSGNHSAARCIPLTP